MSHLNPGLLSAYNSLKDKHLAGYFSNTRIRRHLQRAGLITRSGRIVPDKEYRHKLIQKAHQRHIRECLAQAIFHKVLEMERVHQIEIKRKLEEFARRERVHKIKVERSKRYEEDIIRILSPHPPTGARAIRKQHSGPEGENSESSESPGSSRPNTAPGTMQRPARLKPIHSNSTTASLRRSSPYRLPESSNENDQLLNCTMDKESRRRLTTMEPYRGISPYCLPVINNFVTPVPPATKRKDRVVKVPLSSTLRGRRLRPTTASSGADLIEDPPMLRSSVLQSRVCVNMIYFGKTVHLSHDLTDMRDEVKVFQQHCGGENLCVFKGMLHEGETFQFISRRHRGFPFSLTFYLNGLQVERLSSCCEFKHRKGPRLGGRHGHFGFCGVEGASPCYKCIIAMGLDKKPTPPPKRVKEDGGREETVLSPKGGAEMETERTGDNASSHSECKTSQPQDMKTQVKKETADEDKVRDDYEEDFEADDEGPADDDRAKEKKSSSPSPGIERQVKEERDASETEDDEKDEDMKSRSGSSFSGSEQEESDAEATKDSREDEKAEQPKEVDQEETTVLPDEKNDEPNQEEAAEAEAEAEAPKDSGVQGSAGHSTEIDYSISSGNENKQSEDTLGEKEVEKTLDESKQELEQERAKSVQEKLAEAILKGSQCNSEPELSDTSTEEEESIEKWSNQDSKDAEQQQTLVKETKCEEDVREDEVVQDHEEMSEPRGQNDKTQQEPQGQKVEIEDGDEKTASEEDKNTDNDKIEDTEDTDAALHPVSEQEMADGDKSLEPQEDAATKSADGEAAEEHKESEEKTAAEVDTQPGETGREAKSSEEDESSISELNKNTDETASPDDAEAEAMTASETMEMKAEPSEEKEALNCEEAPVTDKEKRQQKDSEDRDAASETEVTAENSSSSMEGSGDTTVEKTADITADISEDNAKDESSKDGVEEEEVSAVEASKDDRPQERDDLGKEETDTSPVEMKDKVEKKCEEEGQEKEKQTNPDDITQGENREESKKDDTDKTEEEENESKMAESMENSNSELTKSVSNTEGKANEEQAEKTHSDEDNVANEEKADESENTERDKDSKSIGNKNDEQQSEENLAATDETNEVETAADGEENDEAEQEEKDQNKDKDEIVAKNEGDEECQERKVDETVGVEEISEITEESGKSADANLDKDVKIPDENTVQSEDVADSEAADVAHGTKTAEETPSNVMEAEDVKKETEGGSDYSEKGEVDVENGEIFTVAASKTCEDEGEAQTEGKDDKRTTEEPAAGESTEVKEVTVDSEDGAENHEDNNVDEAPDTDVVQSDAKEGDGSAEKQNESIENDSEPKTAGRELKEEFKLEDGEETKQDEKGNLSDPDHEDRELDLIKKSDNIQSNATEVIVASSGDQAQSLTPTAVDSHHTAHKLDKSTAPSDAETDKHPHVDENAAAAAELSVTDGENGADTEEASKASEEGASVLLKPHAQASQLTQIIDNTDESAAVVTATPEALAREDNTDLVTNWITMHQTSKYFETFVEPLEDLKESASDAQVSDANEEVTQSTELPRSESSLQMAKMTGNAEQERTPKDVNESKDKIKEEAVVLNLESNHSENGELCEKDTLQVEEETEVEIMTSKEESEQNNKESVNGQDTRSEEHKGSRRSVAEDKVHEGFMQDSAKQTDFSITEVESIANTHHSVTSGRPESVHENQTEEETTDAGPELNEKQTAVEEVKDLLPSSKTEERHEQTTSPVGLSKLDEPKDTEETWAKSNEQSREVTEITDFTTSKSDDGSQEESPHEDIQHKPSDESISGDRRDMQLIQDIKHTLSKDRLSTFSVDETLFAQSPYPLLTAARTESGH